MLPPPELGSRSGIPHLFCCSISLDLMSDPVTLPTGQTYDRLCIQKWLADGNRTCPVTQILLSVNDNVVVLVPNHTLRRLIQGWCITNKSGSPGCIPTQIAPSTVDSDCVTDLVATLLAASDSNKASPLKRLCELAKNSEHNRRLILDSAAIPTLIHIAFDGNPHQCGAQAAGEDALGLLVSIGPTSSALAAMCHHRRLRALSHYLQWHRHPEVRINAAFLVETLATINQGHTNVAVADGIMDGLVGLIRHAPPLTPCRAIKVGLRALFATCLFSSNKAKAVVAGAGSVLIECLFSWPGLDLRDIERALATLELLCKIADGRQALGGHVLTVPVMKKMILRVSEKASENAASILATICKDSDKVREEALRNGVFVQLLLLLQSKCSCRAKKKARHVLKLLHDKWPNHLCIEGSGMSRVSGF